MLQNGKLRRASESEVNQQLLAWSKLSLSWLGRKDVIKMNILPHFLFLVLNVITDISSKPLRFVQIMIDIFICNY